MIFLTIFVMAALVLLGLVVMVTNQTGICEVYTQYSKSGHTGIAMWYWASSVLVGVCVVYTVLDLLVVIAGI